MSLFEKSNNNHDNKLSKEEIDNLVNDIYAKDEKGRFKTLNFQDYKGGIDYRGKREDELSIDEIVRIKQSSAFLYDILENLTVSDIEAVKLISKVLETPFNEIIFYTKKIEDNLLYASVPVKGGGSIIIDPRTKEYLFAASFIDYDTHLQEYKNGRRTPRYNDNN